MTTFLPDTSTTNNNDAAHCPLAAIDSGMPSCILQWLPLVQRLGSLPFAKHATSGLHDGVDNTVGCESGKKRGARLE